MEAGWRDGSMAEFSPEQSEPWLHLFCLGTFGVGGGLLVLWPFLFYLFFLGALGLGCICPGGILSWVRFVLRAFFFGGGGGGWGGTIFVLGDILSQGEFYLGCNLTHYVSPL